MVWSHALNIFFFFSFKNCLFVCFQEEYIKWVVDDCRTIADILQDLPSLQVPGDHLLELLPRLQPRYYSISSSPKVRG